MNFQALGEHTMYMAQARDAAGRRFALMRNAAVALGRAADRPEQTQAVQQASAALQEAAAVELELQAALARANQAACLCGKPELRLDQLRLFKE